MSKVQLFYIQITEQEGRGVRGEGCHPSDFAVLADGHLVRGPLLIPGGMPTVFPFNYIENTFFLDM